jgi:hypothetical protein
MSSEFAVLGCMHKLGIAGEEVGITKADWNALAQDKDALAQLLAWRRGKKRIVDIDHVVDCSATPYIPEGWEVRPEDQIGSRFTGEFKLTREAVKLYLDAAQQGRGVVKGTQLVKRLEGQLVLPANVLDYYLANPDQIPDSWKGKLIFFWGTVYRSADGNLCVHCLRWAGGSWYWDYRWLGHEWHSASPAAVPAS